MKHLTSDELVATLAVWRGEDAGCLGVFTTPMGKFVFGAARVSEASPTSITITMIKVVKTFELVPVEETITEVTFAPSDVVSAWHAPIAELSDPGFLGDYYDESVQLVIHGEVVGVTLYRKTAFHQRAGA